MIELRKSVDRGHANHGWLDTKHSFSFASYYDPQQMGFRDLRVINEDWIAGGKGFPTHPHQDMEILSYVTKGELEHKDSMGHGSVIRAGDFQLMSAGTGVTHSEFNPSKTEPATLLQIWIRPGKLGLTPTYQQRAFPGMKGSQWQLVASPDGKDGSLTIQQDMALYSVILGAKQFTDYSLAKERHAWIQVVKGSLKINGHALTAGDGIAFSDEELVDLSTEEENAELLFFDLV